MKSIRVIPGLLKTSTMFNLLLIMLFRRPMHTFYQVTCDVLKDYGFKDVDQVFTYEKFKLAWYSFLQLLDKDFASAFMCPICSSTPDIIICDGTSVSFQSRMWHCKALETPSTSVLNVACR